MSSEIRDILKKYWGYDHFRPLQEDIIKSVMQGQDTIALMPTGGGKSICYQIPVASKQGTGLIISPLIALMEDQVSQLKMRGLTAVALTSALTYSELDIALENAINGVYKFVYLSPERLQTDLVQERLKRLKVNLIAVDEAHCISQWGHDFRPSYLNIRQGIEELHPVAIIALTATATPKVVSDIESNLFSNPPKLYQQSFFRENLAYKVVHTERKWGKLINTLKTSQGSAIVYVRNRKHTVKVSNWLVQNGFSSEHYHAGLSHQQRAAKQEKWIKGQTRIMVCTNAFGMGIDKSDVCFVFHIDLPDSLEAYFQEAGRAGRDGKPAESIVLVGPSDVDDLKSRYLNSFPSLEDVQTTYQALANHLQLALGTGEGQSFEFDLRTFCRDYSLTVNKAYQALTVLEKEGLISLNNNWNRASRLMIIVNRTELYDFQLRNQSYDGLIKTLVRSYGGLETEYTTIDEKLLSERLSTTPDNIKNGLLQLRKHSIVDYIPKSKSATISFLTPRQKKEYLNISDENLKHRFEDLKKRIESVANFINNSTLCRSRQLLQYFGEDSQQDCGICDVCQNRQKPELDSKKLNITQDAIKMYLSLHSQVSVQKLSDDLAHEHPNIVEVITWMLDNGQIQLKNGLITIG